MAMPCREFIAVRGFSARIDLALLDSLQDDGWFAIPAAIREDPLAVAVHLALVVLCNGQVLTDEAGHLVQHGPVLPEDLANRPLLKGLKHHAETRTGTRLGVPGRAELIGYLHEPKLLPRCMMLVYRCIVPPGTAPAGGVWRHPTEAAALTTDPLDKLLLAAVPGAPRG